MHAVALYRTTSTCTCNSTAGARATPNVAAGCSFGRVSGWGGNVSAAGEGVRMGLATHIGANVASASRAHAAGSEHRFHPARHTARWAASIQQHTPQPVHTSSVRPPTGRVLDAV